MNKISKMIDEIECLEQENGSGGWLQNVHPLPKLLVTVFFIMITVSFGKYNLAGLLLMGIYLIVSFTLGEISVRLLLKRWKILLILVCLYGIANPFLDRQVFFTWGKFAVTGGELSMLTLAIKGIFTVSATYLLIMTTSVYEICYALRKLHVPKFFVTLLLLIYRYLFVLMREAERMTEAYTLRAPGQRGVHYKVWGTLIGQLLLRSMNRAEGVYDSMRLRGYRGEFRLRCKKKAEAIDVAFAVFWMAGFLALRIIAEI